MEGFTTKKVYEHCHDIGKGGNKTYITAILVNNLLLKIKGKNNSKYYTIKYTKF